MKFILTSLSGCTLQIQDVVAIRHTASNSDQVRIFEVYKTTQHLTILYNIGDAFKLVKPPPWSLGSMFATWAVG